MDAVRRGPIFVPEQSKRMWNRKIKSSGRVGRASSGVGALVECTLMYIVIFPIFL